MRTVYQEDEFGCGIACIAMFSGLTYHAAKKIVAGIEGLYDESSGIDYEPMFDFLRIRGFMVSKKFALNLENPITRVSGNAIVDGFTLGTRGSIRRNSERSHWVVWDAESQVIRDPAGYTRPFLATKCWKVS
ncbi:hypothetical protein [Novosphingobium sp. PC22D]|uniref:hypothetical protein n=1 Tax=Novosphingobium sp. PC22D TaxID=1962403 RepID=UPI0011453176|nr:hypothetical protein [Novosphingobium sp. PC22D]